MAARMQAETAGGPVLLGTAEDAGHAGGESAETIVAEQTDRRTFRYEALGMAGKTSARNGEVG